LYSALADVTRETVQGPGLRSECVVSVRLSYLKAN